MPDRLASILIPVRGLLPATRRCLESVAANTPEPHELIVVDNASPAPTRRWLEGRARRGELRLIRNPENRGFAASINQAARASRGRILVWLNNDTAVGPEWLERLAACLEREPSAGAVGPCTNDPDSGSGRGSRHEPGAEELDAFAAAWALRFDRQREVVDGLSGFCLAVRREAAEAVGPLDERFLWGEEDTDYCLRLRLAGYKLLLARDVYVRHEGGATRGRWGALRRARLTRHNRELLREKWVRLAGKLRRDAQEAVRELA